MSDALKMPHSLEMEMAVIGGIIVDNGAWLAAAEKLSAEDFYSPVCQKIWETASKELLAGRPVTGVGLQTLLESDPDIREAGGGQLWARLIAGAAFGPEAGGFASTIRELAIRRRMIETGRQLAMMAREMGPAKRLSAPELLMAAQQKLAGVAVTVAPDSWRESRSSIVGALREVVEGKTSSGISTGLKRLDQKTGGMFRGELIVIGGRPGMGKSALADQIEQNVAMQDSPDPRTGAPGPLADEGRRRRVVAKFSLEMDHRQLGYRAASRLAQQLTGEIIPYESFRRGVLTEKQWATIQKALEQAPEIFWDTTPHINLHHMRTALKRLVKRYGRLDLVTTDYIQIMDQQREKGQTEAAAVGQLTKGLKAIAREFDVPVLALSQLSRDVEKREDKRPTMSDLRDSGSIEADADTVLLPYRPYYYLSREPEPKDPKKAEQREAEIAQAEPEVIIIVGKQRMGSPGEAKIHWCAETSYMASDRADVTGGASRPAEPNLFEEAFT